MSMSLTEFKHTLSEETPPSLDNPLLTAVWYGLKDEWDESHDIAQDIPGKDAARVHAWLHRIEGDAFNAGYWYQRAGISPSKTSLRDEGMTIAQDFLKTAE